MSAARSVASAFVAALVSTSALAADAACDLDDVAGDTYAAVTVEAARRCVAGEAACCDAVEWIPGVGPADLRDLPRDLAVRLEPALDARCRAGDEVACRTRATLLVRLHRRDEAIAWYTARCPSEWWSCSAAADLHAAAGRAREAVARYLDVCARAPDGDAGASCAKAAAIQEELGRDDEARRSAAAGCAQRSGEACLAARRLSGRKLPKGSWEGLYRSGAGTLYVEDRGGGRVHVMMATLWANGHTCTFAGDGRVSGERGSLQGDGDCRPVLVRRGASISIADPNDACRPASCGARGVFAGTFELDAR